MRKILAIISMLPTLFFVTSAYAEYECEVNVNIETLPVTSTNVGAGFHGSRWWSEQGIVWSKNFPEFTTSGIDTFGLESIVLGVNPNTFLPGQLNDVPTRVENCMLKAAEQVFGNLEQKYSYEGQLIGYTATDESLFIELLSKTTNPNIEYGYCSGAQSGLPLKFSARKISNKNKWHHEYSIIYPKSNKMEGGFCKQYFESPCPMPIPDSDSTGVVEDDLSGDAIDDLFEPDSSFADDTPAPDSSSVPEEPVAPPCVLAPYNLQGLHALSTSHNAVTVWQDTGFQIGIPTRRLKIGDFTGDGRDDILLPTDGTVISFSPSSTFHKNCSGYRAELTGNTVPTGSSLGITIPNSLNRTPFCVNSDDLPINENALKIADINGSTAKEIINVSNAQWSYFKPDTGQWAPITQAKQTVVTYLPQSGQSDSSVTLPKPASYWTQLDAKRINPDFVDFGIFYLDRKEDAFLVYDNKWWVNNNASSKWEMTADLNNIVPEATTGAVIGDKSGSNSGKMASSTKQVKSKRIVNPVTKQSTKPMISATSIKDPQESAVPLNFAKVLGKATNLKLADFTGDGITDVFVSVSGRWILFPSAGHQYRILRHSNKSLSEVQFGDFNGDGVMDVFEKNDDQWHYYSKGEGQPKTLQSSTQDVQDLRPFNGDTDAKSDILSSTFVIPNDWNF